MKKALILFGCLAATTLQAQITTIAGNGTGGYSTYGVAATTAELDRPYGLVVAGPDSDVYFADSGSFIIGGVNFYTNPTYPANTFDYFVGKPNVSGDAGDGGDAYSATLGGPVDIKAAGGYGGSFFIADAPNNVIRTVNPRTNVITVYAGNGTSGYSGDGGQATAAQLDNIGGICLDASNNLYITCGGSVRKVNAATGIITTIAGTGTAAPDPNANGVPAITVGLDYPKGICWTDSGFVIFCDAGNNEIRGIRNDSLYTLAGYGAAGYAGDGSYSQLAQLNNPQYLDIDKNGNVFFSDGGNNCIREINWADETISTVVGDGSGTAGFAGDGGAATTAQLNFPTGVALDGEGNLYISDCYNNRIRKVEHITQGLGVKKIATESAGMTVYPNPSTGAFVISLPETVSYPIIRVVDATGKAVFTQYADNRNVRNIPLNVKSVVPGTYFINVTSGDKTYSQKLTLL